METFKIEDLGNVVVITLLAECVAENDVDAFRSVLFQFKFRDVVLDMTRASHVSNFLFCTIIASCEGRISPLRICGGPPDFQETLKFINATFLHVFKTRQEAMAEWEKPVVPER